VELLLQLEQQFDVRISIEDIDLDDLRTLQRIARVVVARSVGEPASPEQPAISSPPFDGDGSPRSVERRSEGRREASEDETVLAAPLLAIDKT
jgi:hypothetical protein